MTDNDSKHAFERSVMDAIRSGRARMRPRWKFVLSGALAALGVIVLLFTLLFIASFAIFALRQSGALFMPFFGMRGMFVFFAALPLILVGLLLLFLVILEILVRRYRVGYRTPLLVSVLAILAVVVLGGSFIERTRVHEDILRQARLANELPPPIAIVYRSGTQHIPGVYHGTIVSMLPGGFKLLDDNGAGTTTVLLGPATVVPFGIMLASGEEVVVFGQSASGTVHALGVVQVSD